MGSIWFLGPYWNWGAACVRRLDGLGRTGEEDNGSNAGSKDGPGAGRFSPAIGEVERAW